MHFTLTAEKESCTLTEKTDSSTNVFPMPVRKDVLVGALKTLLHAPDQFDITLDDLNVSRVSTGLKIQMGHGNYTIPYSHIFTLVS